MKTEYPTRSDALGFWANLLRVVPLLAIIAIVHAEPLGTHFSFQGVLQIDGTNADGIFDFQMEPFDSPLLGTSVGTAVTIENIAVTGGSYNLELDFGIGPFNGERVWLEVHYRRRDQGGDFERLPWRDELSATPYALHAEFVALGSVGSQEIDTTQVQQRITGRCARGWFVRAVREDGSVRCRRDDVGLHQVSSADIVDGTVSAVDLAMNSVGADQISGGAVGSADVDPEQVQLRISASCPPGSSIRMINAEGSVSCQADQTVATGIRAGLLLSCPLCPPPPQCHPLQPQTYPEGMGCYPVGDTFWVAPDASPVGNGSYGSSCQFPNVCHSGLACLGAAATPNCPSSDGCCSHFCTVGDDSPCDVTHGQYCQPWYELEEAPPGFESLGVCALPS